MSTASGPAVRCASAATLVIFGGTGDLTKRLLIPSLVNLARDGLISDRLDIVAVSFEEGTDQSLRGKLGEFVPAPAGAEAGSVNPTWDDLRCRISYLRGDFNDPATYRALAERLQGNAAFYLATAPTFFGSIIEHLADAGILKEDVGFRRVVIEKPFGHDLASAKSLNSRILARIPESQIYRIDHFLGKETVRNILAFRFANGFLEAVWNNHYIDHVQITAAEVVGVGTRGKFYDATGALRDMVPNHLFQLLAMVGMEPPNSFDAEAIRDEKSRVLRAVRGPKPDHVSQRAVRGQYRCSDGSGSDYRSELDVNPATRTETYAAVKFGVDTWRWAGVPFYLRTGKALSARDTEIVIQFKSVPFALFSEPAVSPLPPNRLVLQIQPDEGISIDFLFKVPGAAVELCSSRLDFRYADQFAVQGRTGYEALLYDVLIGDQTLFQRADMIEAGWAAIQPILDAWSWEGEPEGYPSGSAGPAAAEALLARDDRAWHAIG